MKIKEKILLADDEKELTRAVKIILEHNGYEVDVVENGAEVLKKLETTTYDLIILDIMMPKKDGVQTVIELREHKIMTPVLFLTAKSLIDDKVHGLDAGANDYLTKPFNKKELLARIRALTRYQKKEELRIGNVVFDKENLLLSNNNVSLYLGEKEAQVLELLEEHRGDTVSIDNLKRHAEIPIDTDNNIVKLYISYLDSKFKILDRNVKIFFSNSGCGLKC